MECKDCYYHPDACKGESNPCQAFRKDKPVIHRQSQDTANKETRYRDDTYPLGGREIIYMKGITPTKDGFLVACLDGPRRVRSLMEAETIVQRQARGLTADIKVGSAAEVRSY